MRARVVAVWFHRYATESRPAVAWGEWGRNEVINKGRKEILESDGNSIAVMVS